MTSQNASQPELISITEAAEVFQVPRASISNWVTRGALKVLEVASTEYGRPMFLVDKLEAWDLACAWHAKKEHIANRGNVNFKTVRVDMDIYMKAVKRARKLRMPVTHFVEDLIVRNT